MNLIVHCSMTLMIFRYCLINCFSWVAAFVWFTQTFEVFILDHPEFFPVVEAVYEKKNFFLNKLWSNYDVRNVLRLYTDSFFLETIILKFFLIRKATNLRTNYTYAISSPGSMSFDAKNAIFGKRKSWCSK